MSEGCKRCLLYEAGERVTLNEINEYIKTLPKDELVDGEAYGKRISFCKECDFLISGMCRKCGCYVEIRARLKDSDCPNVNDRKW